MKFRASGEIDSTIEDSFREAMNAIRKEVGQLLLVSLYGNGLAALDIVIMITAGQAVERFRFNPETKATDIRIALNHEVFKKADLINKKKLLYDALIRSVYTVTENHDIQNFDSSKLIRDLARLKENG